MRIGTNVAAIVANNALQKSQNNLSTSIERLSSGYKINGSKDDAAGCAISEKMRAQIRGLSQAQNIVGLQSLLFPPERDRKSVV